MEPCKSRSAIAAEANSGDHCRNLRSAFPRKSARPGLSFYVTIVVFSLSFVLFTSTSFAWQRLAAISKAAPNSSPMFNEGDRTSVVGLIDLLDSPAFSQRQSATDSIIEYGDAALPDLSQRFFEGSPETNYRIRKALEGIAAAGDEETFLKSSAILLTLYSNGNDHISQQIEELKVKWQAQRTEIAIQTLKQSGAEVIQKQGYNTRFAGRRLTITPRGGVQVSSSPQTKFVKRTASEQKDMVDKILRSDAESNKDFIFKLMPDQARVNPSLAINAINLNQPHMARTLVTFPADWAVKNTDARLLKELHQIDDYLLIQFSNANFSNAQWRTITAADNIVALDLATKEKSAQVPATFPKLLQSLTLTGFEINDQFAASLQRSPQLQQLQFNNCNFDERSAEKIDGIKTIKSVVCQFENQTLDMDVVLAMAEFDDLRALNLTAVKFSDAALQKLRRLDSVSFLYVNDMPATSRFFQNVGAMPRLSNIQFSGCKLDIPAYKKLASAQRVRMSFEAQAFLGIQGSNVAMNGRMAVADAMVSMVVPDSAAEEGGIKAGDIINKIDGEKVNDFNDVRLHITQYNAGDEVDIEVLRDGKPEALRVKLRDFKTARKQ